MLLRPKLCLCCHYLCFVFGDRRVWKISLVLCRITKESGFSGLQFLWPRYERWRFGEAKSRETSFESELGGFCICSVSERVEGAGGPGVSRGRNCWGRKKCKRLRTLDSSPLSVRSVTLKVNTMIAAMLIVACVGLAGYRLEYFKVVRSGSRTVLRPFCNGSY
jgi:hypothetical protein